MQLVQQHQLLMNILHLLQKRIELEEEEEERDKDTNTLIISYQLLQYYPNQLMISTYHKLHSNNQFQLIDTLGSVPHVIITETQAVSTPIHTLYMYPFR